MSCIPCCASLRLFAAVGKEYAMGHLAVFLARLSTSCEWTRVRSAVSALLE
jgi:hypothetical protein